MTILCESRSKVLSSSAVMSAISQFNDSCSAGAWKSNCWNFKPSCKANSNLPPLESRALKEHTDIIILPFDKGHATEIMDRDEYNLKLSAMLSDTSM